MNNFNTYTVLGWEWFLITQPLYAKILNFCTVLLLRVVVVVYTVIISHGLYIIARQ